MSQEKGLIDCTGTIMCCICTNNLCKLCCVKCYHNSKVLNSLKAIKEATTHLRLLYTKNASADADTSLLIHTWSASNSNGSHSNCSPVLTSSYIICEAHKNTVRAKQNGIFLFLALASALVFQCELEFYKAPFFKKTIKETAVTHY